MTNKKNKLIDIEALIINKLESEDIINLYDYIDCYNDFIDCYNGLWRHLGIVVGREIAIILNNQNEQ